MNKQKKSPVKKPVKKTSKKVVKQPSKSVSTPSINVYGSIPEYSRTESTEVSVPVPVLVDILKDYFCTKHKLIFYVHKNKLTVKKSRGKLGFYKDVKVSDLNKKDKAVIKTMKELAELVK